MKLIKLTALTSILLAWVIGFSSCEKDADTKVNIEFSKTGIVMSGAQGVPPSTSTALGSMDIFYTRDTKTLTYTIRWQGLTGNVTSAHLHGPAPIGYAAAIIQTITTTGLTSTGTLSGTMFFDGAVYKEQDLLNGFYYIDIHTATYPTNSEIRGQIRF